MQKILIGHFDHLVKEVKAYYRKISSDSNNSVFENLFKNIEPIQDNQNIEKLFNSLIAVEDNSIQKKQYLARASHFFYSRKVLFSQKESYVYLTNVITRNDIIIHNNKTLFVDSAYNIIHCSDENNISYSFTKDINELYIVIGKYHRAKISYEELAHELARREFWTRTILEISKNNGAEDRFSENNLVSADELLKRYDERFKPFH